jgi:hypothetical protein
MNHIQSKNSQDNLAHGEVLLSTRIPQLDPAESAMQNLSAAKTMGSCLSGCIDQR